MKGSRGWLAGAAAAAVLGGLGTGSAAAGALYNMDELLRQPHPFAAQVQPVPRAEPARPLPPAPPPRLAPPPTVTPARAAPDAEPAAGTFTDIFSEVRLGALVHDEGPFGSHKEGGADVNLEVLFASPEFLKLIWSPRPHLGGSANSQGDTSQFYFGLTWEWVFLEGAFFDFSFGGAVHTGETTKDVRDSKALGCRVLFREAIDLGYRFAGRHAVMAHLDHISNAKICDKNEGLDSVGVRYGYMF